MRGILNRRKEGAPGNKKNKFFDPKKPERPEKIAEIDTRAILRLGEAVTAFSILPPKINLGLYTLPDAISILPLIEQMQQQENPEDLEAKDIGSTAKQ